MSGNLIFILIAIFAVMALAFAFARYYANEGKGQAFKTKSGKEFFWRYTPGSKGSAPKATICIDARPATGFCLMQEDMFDRFAKWLGIASEFQTQDAAFDRKVYIQSDDPDFGHKLRGNPSLRRQIEELFSDCSSLESDVKKHYLRVRMREVSREPDLAAIDATVERLYAIAHSVSGAGYRPESMRRKLFVWASACYVLPVSGFVLFAALPHRLVSYHDIILDTVIAVIVGVMLGLVLLRRVFRGSSYGADALKNFLLGGIIGLAATSYCALYYANYALDGSEAEAHTQVIMEKFTTKARRGGTHYHVRVSGWHKNAEAFSMEVGYPDYEKASMRGKLEILTHPGHLGYEWIEDYRVL